MHYPPLTKLVLLCQCIASISFASPLPTIRYRSFLHNYATKFLQRPNTLYCEPKGHKKFLGVFMLYSIGSTFDAYMEKLGERAKLLAIEAQLKSGIIPPLTLENIKKYPHYKDAYLAYAFAHYTDIDPLITTALFREYPTQVTRMLIKKANKKYLQ